LFFFFNFVKYFIKNNLVIQGMKLIHGVV